MLEAEIALRKQTANVANLRSQVPLGHPVAEDYRFEWRVPDGAEVAQVSLSSLFAIPDRCLVIYSFLHTANEPPCPMCNAFLDSFCDVARHAKSQLNLAVVAKAEPFALSRWARSRG